jgi:hypothetical protein
MGGQIEKVDLVRDQLALKVAGGHAVNILFDERTQVYQDGKKMSVLNLHPEDHASIETTLDGTAIFALRIHALSALPDGQLHGQIASYDPGKRELKLQVANSKDLMTIVTPDGVPVTRIGQSAFAKQKAGVTDLVRGALVDVTFKSGQRGHAVATRLDVLAVPGADFVFRGKLASLDLRAGRMSILNTESGDQPVDVTFEPSRFKASQDLHQGSAVKVTARFDGTHYIASDVAIE